MPEVTMRKASCLVLILAILNAAGYAAPLNVEPDGHSAQAPPHSTEIAKTPPAAASPPVAVIVTYRAGEPSAQLLGLG